MTEWWVYQSLYPGLIVFGLLLLIAVAVPVVVAVSAALLAFHQAAAKEERE
jgi:apolipoprotein N-acyltransferase